MQISEISAEWNQNKNEISLTNTLSCKTILKPTNHGKLFILFKSCVRFKSKSKKKHTDAAKRFQQN